MNRWIQLNGSATAAAVDAIVDFASQAWARRRQRRLTRDIYETLVDLDDRTLRDLGFDRSEAMSIAVEITQQAEHTRLSARPVLPGMAESGRFPPVAGCTAR